MSYETNRYKLIFVTFMGVNHCGESILFGCGLLPNTTVNLFAWLFNKWLEAMAGGTPKVILTNQVGVMTIAIQLVMPTTCHGFNVWPMFDKIPVKLGGILIRNDDFLGRLKHCIFSSDTPKQFGLEWDKMLAEFGIADNNL